MDMSPHERENIVTKGMAFAREYVDQSRNPKVFKAEDAVWDETKNRVLDKVRRRLRDKKSTLPPYLEDIDRFIKDDVLPIVREELQAAEDDRLVYKWMNPNANINEAATRLSTVLPAIESLNHKAGLLTGLNHIYRTIKQLFSETVSLLFRPVTRQSTRAITSSWLNYLEEDTHDATQSRRVLTKIVNHELSRMDPIESAPLFVLLDAINNRDTDQSRKLLELLEAGGEAGAIATLQIIVSAHGLAKRLPSDIINAATSGKVNPGITQNYENFDGDNGY